jgi:hypothetical protein
MRKSYFLVLQVLRYIASPLVGVATFFLLMDTLTGYLPVDFVSVTVLATCYLAAAAGGFATAAVAPRLKLGLATATGALFPTAYYLSVLLLDWPGGADPLSLDVMWSLGLIPCFSIGGGLGYWLTGSKK